MLKKIIFITIIVAILTSVGIIKINGTKVKAAASSIKATVTKYVRTDEIKKDVKESLKKKVQATQQQ